MASMARLLVSHAEAVLEDASKVLVAIEPLLLQWDFEDPMQGREIRDRLRQLLPGSPQIVAAWVLDGKGINKLDTWTFPAKPIDASRRPYFRAHMEGASDPVIIGDATPGSVTGEERFTFSRTLRDPDGTLRGVMVVATYTGYFEKLYTEVANWDRARAGIYVEGVPYEFSSLARLRTVVRASPDYIFGISEVRKKSMHGGAIVNDGRDVRVAGWRTSEKYPALYAVISQPLNVTLGDWLRQSLLFGGASLTALAGLLGLAVIGAHRAAAREAERVREMLAREVHHRVKNSLQIVAGLLSMRAKSATASEAKTALVDGARQVEAIANVHELMQVSVQLDRIDLNALLEGLCASLGKSADKMVSFSGCGQLMMDPSRASSVAIVVNEVVTNAMKHMRETVTLTCEHEGVDILLTVRDDGPGMPPDFDPLKTGRFGLATANRLCRFLEGGLSWETSPSGTIFLARVRQEASAT
ncbi:MAG: sensor histidine kinase [Beijerinckiaceae bacterium]|nr:sensor histidine kinase [Beijerinckiaceae bacterium]